VRVSERPDPVLVTTASRSPGEERRDRERRYLLLMGVRVVAFIVAIVFARGWIRYGAIVLSLVIPWIAVVLANAIPSSSTETRKPSLFVRRAPKQIGPGRG
jgi:xanthine/uracil permease